MLPTEAINVLCLAERQPADDKRATLRQLFTDAVTDKASQQVKAEFARTVGKTIGQVTDLMPIEALAGGVRVSFFVNPDVVVEHVMLAIKDTNVAMPNKRSRSGFGYGHHYSFGDIPPLENARQLATDAGIPLPTLTMTQTTTKETTMDINHLADLACQLSSSIASADALDTSSITATDMDNADAKACDALAHAKALNPDQATALRSAVAVINMNRTPEERANVSVSDEVKAMAGSSDEPPPAAASSQPVEPIPFDSGMARAVDSLLTAATNGKVTSIETTLADLTTLRAKAQELADQLARANARPVVAIPTGGEQTVDGSKLTYEVVMRQASDIFKNPKSGKSMSQLKFDIPTLVWKDDTGAVVQHPMIPAVDDNYQFRMTHVLKLATAFLMSKNVWAHGHTGTGKTTLFEQFYARIGFPVYRLNLDSNLERADLVGQTTLAESNGVTVSQFCEGILPQAMVQPCALILDEIDAGRPDILFTIQRATEGNGLMLTEDGGRLVRPHPLFRFCATANSRGQGDEFGVYAGVRPMNTAMLDRFGVMIEVGYLEMDEESSFLSKAYPSLSKDVVKQLTTFAKLIRDAFTNGEVSLTLSPRGLKSIAETYSFFDPLLGTTKAMEMAVEMVVIDRATMDNRQRVLELRERAFKA